MSVAVRAVERAIVLLFVLVLAAGSVACRASSNLMRPSAPQAIVPAPDAAVVVFVRPSGFAGGIVTTIVDGHGRFLGDSEAESHFAVRLPPGEHVFIAWSEGTPALRATLTAGRVYFVEVAPKMGAWSARVQLLALKPRSENWPAVPGWLRETKLLVADEAAARAKMAERAEDLRETVAKGVSELRGYDAEDLAARTLVVEDGVAGALAAARPAAPPPASPPASAAPSPAAAAPTPAPAPAPAPAPTPAAAPAERPSAATRADVVRLRAGGRMQGKVMEDEPAGVSIVLADGTVRRVKRAEVERVDYGR